MTSGNALKRKKKMCLHNTILWQGSFINDVTQVGGWVVSRLALRSYIKNISWRHFEFLTWVGGSQKVEFLRYVIYEWPPSARLENFQFVISSNQWKTNIFCNYLNDKHLRPPNDVICTSQFKAPMHFNTLDSLHWFLVNGWNNTATENFRKSLTEKNRSYRYPMLNSVSLSTHLTDTTSVCVVSPSTGPHKISKSFISRKDFWTATILLGNICTIKPSSTILHFPDKPLVDFSAPFSTRKLAPVTGEDKNEFFWLWF